jgi:hypothetical protein
VQGAIVARPTEADEAEAGEVIEKGGETHPF